MPFWLVIAISCLWVAITLMLALSLTEYVRMSPMRQRAWQPGFIIQVSAMSWIPFTIFWWSWVIFG